MLKQSKVAREGGEEGGNGELLDLPCAKHLVQNTLHCSRVDDSRKRVGGIKNFKCLSCQKPNNECLIINRKGCSQGHNNRRRRVLEGDFLKSFFHAKHLKLINYIETTP